MNIPKTDHIFNRSGLAAFSDLNSIEQKDLFSKLEKEQDSFLERQSEFLSRDYKWPLDPLHTWSRIWEYPYVYYHLKKAVESPGLPHDFRVVDLGSAVTFFPFSIAKLGCRVHCLDIDSTCGPNLERAANVVSHSPGKVDFGMISDGRFPLKDGEVDAVYCVSVLEHIPDFENTIEEVYRILKPNGLFVLTIDLDLCGYKEIGTSGYYRLRQALSKYFYLKEPEFTMHPMDMLPFRSGPFPYITYSTWQSWQFHMKQRIRHLLGKKSVSFLPNLAVWGAAMTKGAL